MMRIRVIEIDDHNIEHVTRHGVTVEEIERVFTSRPSLRRNKGGATADYYAIANGIRVNFLYFAGVARPISALEIGHLMDTDHRTEAELADWQYAHKGELDAHQGEPVEMDIATGLSVTMSFRLPGREADLIRATADARGLSLSEWIRQACQQSFTDDGHDSERQELQADLDDAMGQLDALRTSLTRVRSANR